MRKGKLAHLRRRSLHELLIAVAERRAPEPRHALDIGLAGCVVDEHALAALEHQRTALAQGREIGIGRDPGLDVADREIAERSHEISFASMRADRARTRQGYRMRKGGGRGVLPCPGELSRGGSGVAHIPFADAIATATLGEIDMHVILMIAVRA